MAKHSTRRERAATEPFIMIKRWEYKCPARQALSGDEWLIYTDMRFRYNGRNNGQIVYSSRQAGDAIGKSHSTGARALNRLMALGFIKLHKNYGFAQKRLCREWELTAIALEPAKRGDVLPTGTKDFMRISERDLRAIFDKNRS